jgi:thiol-disulfide isomerase/thioredoxin
MIITRKTIAAALLVFLTFTGVGPLTSTAFSQNLEPFVSGELANFSLRETRRELPELTFVDRDNKIIKLSDFQGQVILLNFWATWCAPCKREMPSLDRLQGDLQSDDFQVLAVGQDQKGIEKVTTFLNDLGIKNLAPYNDDTLKGARRLGIYGLPGTMLIDRKGLEIGRLIGPAEWDSDEAKAMIRAVIAEQK